MMNSLVGTPFLRRVPLQVVYDDDNFEMTVTLPDWAKEGGVALSAYPFAALSDHEVLSIEHNEIEHVTRNDYPAGANVFGVPLGHIASFIGHGIVADASTFVPGRPLKLWPGFDRAAGMPCERQVAMIPIKGTRQFKISGRRIFGATVITKAYLWLAPVDAELHTRLCDGSKSLIGQPHWLAQRLDLAAAAGVDASPVERDWNQYDDKNLRILQPMAAGYSNDGEVIAYEPAYANATLLRVRGWADERIFPDYAEGAHRLSEWAPATLQEWDCLRDPQIVVPAKSGLRLYTERELTPEDKEIRLTFYGVLTE